MRSPKTHSVANTIRDSFFTKVLRLHFVQKERLYSCEAFGALHDFWFYLGHALIFLWSLQFPSYVLEYRKPF